MRLTHTLTRPDRPLEVIRLYIDGTPRSGNVESVIRYTDRDTGEPVEHRWSPYLISATLENQIRAQGMERLGWTLETNLDR